MRIVIPLFDRFTALDAVGPFEVLSRLPGAEVVFAATTPGTVRADGGALGLQADAAFADIASCDVLVVPGGFGTRSLLRDETMLGWIRTVDATTAWTTSVCTGSLLLASAGLLDGIEATTHWGASELLESLGARYTPRRVVPAGKIVTAAGVSSGIDMALRLAGWIAGDVTAQAIQLMIEYDPDPPYTTGSLARADPATVERARELSAPRPPR